MISKKKFELDEENIQDAEELENKYDDEYININDVEEYNRSDESVGAD